MKGEEEKAVKYSCWQWRSRVQILPVVKWLLTSTHKENTLSTMKTMWSGSEDDSLLRKLFSNQRSIFINPLNFTTLYDVMNMMQNRARLISTNNIFSTFWFDNFVLRTRRVGDNDQTSRLRLSQSSHHQAKTNRGGCEFGPWQILLHAISSHSYSLCSLRDILLIVGLREPGEGLAALDSPRQCGHILLPSCQSVKPISLLWSPNFCLN